MKYLLLILILTNSLYSQLNLNITNAYVDEEYYIIAEGNLTLFGSQVIPSLDDFFVIEYNFAEKIIDFEITQQNNFRLKWKPNYSVIIDAKDYVGTLICNYQNYISTRTLEFANINTPRLIFALTNGPKIETIDFGNVAIGSTRIRQVILTTTTNRIFGGNITSTRVDSITTKSPYFSVQWDGQLGGINNNPPPTSLLPGGNYLITFRFTPDEARPYSDVFTVHYDNGAKAELILFANKQQLTVEDLDKTYNVLSPNGGEKITPCLEYPINWEGSTLGFQTNLSFSPDSGRNWQQIGSVNSQTFQWEVPSDTTREGLIRIQQGFQNLSRQQTSLGNNRIDYLKFNNSDNLIKLYSDRRIELESGNNFSFSNQITNFEYSGAGFISSQNFIVGVTNLGSTPSTDLILIYNINNPLPEKTISINNSPVNQIITDEQNGYFWVLSKYRKTIYKYNYDGLVDSVNFEEPISSISLSKNTNFLCAASYFGNVNLIDKNTNIKIKELQIDATPYINSSFISPDGRFVALAGKFNEKTNENAYVYLVNLDKGAFQNIFELGASDPLELSFNPNSSMLVIVSKWSPQMFVWDIIENTPIRGFGGVTGEVLSGSFATNNNRITLSSTGPNELTTFRIMFPMSDISDSTFSILKPSVNYDSTFVKEEFIFVKDTVYYQNQICNDGEVDFHLATYWFEQNTNYEIIFDKFRDTLKPNECISFRIIFDPQDIGVLDDVLTISDNCFESIKIPISGIGLPRNVAYFQEQYEFGTLCINDSLTTTINLIQNLDDVNLNITNFEIIDSDGIFILNDFQSTILQENDVLSFNFTVSPLFAGRNTAKLRLYFNNQEKYYFEITLAIDGIGAELLASHDYLPFIIEQNTRKLTITNQFDEEIIFKDVQFIPNNGYSLVSNLPDKISPNETIELELLWDGVYQGEVRLLVNADPCPLANNFVLLPYSSVNFITIPDIIADNAAAEVEIPILIQESPNKNYAGTRELNASISLNPRLFFPLEVTSKFGVGEIISNSIVDNQRVIEVRARGDFALIDTALVIKGVSGIAETDQTPIVFDRNINYLGVTTDNYFSNGSLLIEGLHNDRRVIHTYNILNFVSVSPNPSKEDINVIIDATDNIKGSIVIRDLTGQEIITETHNFNKGENLLNFNLSKLSNGKYYIELHSEEKFLESIGVTLIK